MTSKEFADAQRRRDKRHHELRVKWFESLPVLDSLQLNLLRSSRAILKEGTGARGYNTGPQSDYRWIITLDALHERGLTDTPKAELEPNEVGTFGPRPAVVQSRAELEKNENAEQFRLLDDDRILYYEGVIAPVLDYTMDDVDAWFAPLDDFGMPNAGCTIIRYKNNMGGWEDL